MSNKSKKIDVQGRWILAATIMASGLSFLTGSTVNIALPTIQESFDTSLSGLQWIVNAYLLAIASLLLLGGALADRYGRRRIFTLGISIFTAGSLLSSLAQSTAQLGSLQALQGIGAALMVPTSLTIINDYFPSNLRGKAIGLWSGFSAGLASTGPFIGGWLTETFGWPAVFILNVPVGIVTLLVALKYVSKSSPTKDGTLDWLGALMILSSFFGISFGFIQAPQFGWGNPLVMGSLAGGAILGLILVFHESRHSSPLIPLDILKKRHVAVANVMTFPIYFALLGMIFFFSIIFQQAYNYSPTDAGLALLPSILTITFASGPAGSISDRIGERIPMILGPLLVSIGFGSFLLAGPEVDYAVRFLPGLLLIGSGMALVIPPLTKSALMVERENAGAASGINNSASRVANLIAIALLGSIALTVFSSELKSNLNERDIPAAVKSSIIKQSEDLGDIEIPRTEKTSVAKQAEKAVTESLIASFRWVMGIGSLLSLLAAVFAAVTMKNLPEDLGN